MGFWTLFEVASMPILQVLIISTLGAVMATEYSNLLPADARRSINKIVFMVFTPSLMFASLAKTVTLHDILSWWFMPVNIGLTFLFGGLLGWIVVKILKPKPFLEGLVIATCSSGNMGNLMLIVVPSICKEDGSPFGDHNVCGSVGLSYASFSMALGGFYIWTYTYHLIRVAATKHYAVEGAEPEAKAPNKDLDANEASGLLQGEEDEGQVAIVVPDTKFLEEEDTENQAIMAEVSKGKPEKGKESFWSHLVEIIQRTAEEILAPPTIAAIIGLIFGATTWLRNLIIGDNAPLRVIQNSIELLGDGTIPCITLILGGNLTKGLRSARLKPLIIIAVIFVRYIILPVIGIVVVKTAGNLRFLPSDPLFHYVLMVQFTMPPAMNISTMTQLFDVGQEECSVLFLWTYLVAAAALTAWSTVYMWILS